MLTLYSYPDLFGVADNNPFGLKVFAFMRLCGLAFDHRHVLDTSLAPRGQLPYLVDGDQTIGDSDSIIAHLTRQYDLRIDRALSREDLNLDFMVRRTLDDLYWSMSFSRWRDERFWPSFRDAVLAAHPDVRASDLDAAREYNRLRYHYQGIGRYEPEQIYARGIADLRVVADMLGDTGYVFGRDPATVDAVIYGFIANIYFYQIDTPLKQYVVSRPSLVRHCEAIHQRVGTTASDSPV
ncbi:glutathione S-transferase N-terminal domain-containing protein (plasmid) [Paraburkholderia sprentiae WSM5005]|uniref:Glutathione S-transferase N-terminal domain-containing protein n=1 Tax=Paraburkholderia sprentiae WSM5005 TaxID=754502 RepID=A0A1I9YU04_9BURK|nr:glutathione S-transferase C-terminal domain-containing protein [Paraburkholderia sprentiae]APA89692.1 glutathione S-transferase N-terminal domain-containing protein [Paraburkholderia sprentiae WSM5005]